MASDQGLHFLHKIYSNFYVNDEKFKHARTPKVTNESIQFIKMGGSTSLRWVKPVYSQSPYRVSETPIMLFCDTLSTHAYRALQRSDSSSYLAGLVLV